MKRKMEMANNLCFCGQDEEAHKGLNHEFSPDGSLVQKIPPTPPTPRVAVDVCLRLLLIEKGLITADELAFKEAELRDQLRRSTAGPLDPRPSS
jgi:hypothetical protein